MPDYALTLKLAAGMRMGHWKAPPPEWGRLLTIPEIMDIRRKYDPSMTPADSPWQNSYMTATLEYRGTTAGGVEVAAVRHGNGPSQLELDADPRAFRRLLDGFYGEVHVVETGRTPRKMEGVVGSRRALSDPLVQARFGGEDSLAASLHQVDFQTRAEGRLALAIRTHPAGNEYEAFPPRSGDFVRRLLLSNGLRNRRGTPFDDCCAAVTDREAVLDIAPPVTRHSIANDPDRLAWIVDGSEGARLTRVREFEGVLMTDVEPFDPRITVGWPGHRVRLSKTFRESKAELRLEGDFDVAVMRAAPALANCYMASYLGVHTVSVAFGRAEIDRSLRMPDRHEYGSPTFTADTVGRMGEAWWKKKTARLRDRRTMSETIR